mgnify:CR=1
MVDEETLEYLKESMADILDVMDMLHKEVSNMKIEIEAIRKILLKKTTETESSEEDEDSNMYQ